MPFKTAVTASAVVPHDTFESVVGVDAVDARKPGWEQLYFYWLSKHVDNCPPARCDIDPVTEIPRLVEYLLLIDREAGDYRYRVAGTRVEARCGRGLTGRLIGLEGTPVQLVDQWRAALDRAAHEQKPLLYGFKLPPGIEVIYVALILPLVDRDGRTAKLVVGSFCDGYLPPGTPILEMYSIDLLVGAKRDCDALR